MISLNLWLLSAGEQRATDKRGANDQFCDDGMKKLSPLACCIHISRNTDVHMGAFGEAGFLCCCVLFLVIPYCVRILVIIHTSGRHFSLTSRSHLGSEQIATTQQQHPCEAASTGCIHPIRPGFSISSAYRSRQSPARSFCTEHAPNRTHLHMENKTFSKESRAKSSVEALALKSGLPHQS